MGSRYEVELTLSSAKDLKNANWRHGANKPYAVVWVDPDRKISSRVDEDGDTSPQWNQKLMITVDRPIEDSTLNIDIVHAQADVDTKPLIGSAKLPLQEVIDEAGIGGHVERSLKLKRPSGRPHGKLQVEIVVKQPRYQAPSPYGNVPYGLPGGGPYAGAPPSGYPAYSAQPYEGYPSQGQPPYGQPAYGQPGYAQPAGYVQPSSGYAQPAGYAQPSSGYAQPSSGQSGGYGYGSGAQVAEKKKSKFGLGTGLAVGAVAGVLGAVALHEGIEKFEDHVAEKAAEKVEDDDSDYEQEYNYGSD